LYVGGGRRGGELEDVEDNSKGSQQTSESSSNPLLFEKEKKLSLSSPWSPNLNSEPSLNLARIEKKNPSLVWIFVHHELLLALKII